VSPICKKNLPLVISYKSSKKYICCKGIANGLKEWPKTGIKKSNI